jgi:hypothetical protein
VEREIDAQLEEVEERQGGEEVDAQGRVEGSPCDGSRRVLRGHRVVGVVQEEPETVAEVRRHERALHGEATRGACRGSETLPVEPGHVRGTGGRRGKQHAEQHRPEGRTHDPPSDAR